jgi:DNA-directed RNA polymerase specialized sigma24 family protein
VAVKIQHRLRAPDTFDGSSPCDVVHEVLLKFFSSPTRLGWDGERDLGNYLSIVVSRRLTDHLRRTNKCAASLDDEKFGKSGWTIDQGSEPRTETQISIAQARQTLDPQEQKVFGVMEQEADGTRLTNRDLAKELPALSPQAIEGIRKRIFHKFDDLWASESG